MKSVLISGFHNTGKSTTCLLLKDTLISKGGKLLADLSPKTSPNETIVIIELNQKYYGISSIGDSAPLIEKGFRDLMKIIEQHSVNLDYLFFTSRSKGKNLTTALDIASSRGNDYYQFFSNKIQPQLENPNESDLIFQKQNFLDYILRTSKIKV